MSEHSNQKLKTQPDVDAVDDDLSSAGIIQKTLDEYQESRSKRNFVLPPIQEITVIKQTSCPTLNHRYTTRSGSAKSITLGTSIDQFTLDSKEANSPPETSHSSIRKVPSYEHSSDANNKLKLRRKVISCSDKSTHSSTVHKSQLNRNEDDDEVQLMKVERKISAPIIQQNKSDQGNNCNMNNTETLFGSFSSVGLVVPSPPFSSQPLCNFCGNRGYMCHHYQFSGYCTKACMSYLQMNKQGWEAGFNVENMERVFTNAYNEARRVTCEERFGYYCPGWIEVPGCMKETALKKAVNLGFNPKFCNELREHNEAGKKKYEEAQANQRA